MRFMGIDPGLCHTGWAIIDREGNQNIFIAGGVIEPNTSLTLPERLAEIFQSLDKVISLHRPNYCAVEETFVNVNPRSTLKLGQARGVAVLVPSIHNIPVDEYTPNHIKKAIVGVGHATKNQIDTMIRLLLPSLPTQIPKDTSDAIAMALTCSFFHKK